MEQEEKEISVSLSTLWEVLRRRRLAILITGVLVLSLTAVISIVSYTPEYTATTDVYIINESYKNLTGEPTSDINTYNLALSLIVDCKQILEGKETKEELGRRLGLSAEELDSVSITVKENSKDKSRILNISIVSPEPALSYRLSGEMLTVAQEKISDFCSHDVKLVNSAELPDAAANSPVRPFVFLATLLAVGGVYFVFLLMHLWKERAHAAERARRRGGGRRPYSRKPYRYASGVSYYGRRHTRRTHGRRGV